ncbi:MAG: sialate O-acetylesterase [Bacteroides sp.]|nr:sialate O-acetylesterase [Bacteroides sp.]
MKNSKTLRFGVAALLLNAALSGSAAIDLPDIFSDNMVLQRESKARIWGWVTPGSDIVITTNWNGRQTKGKADTTGRWDIYIDTPEASYEPTSFSINGDSTSIEVNNVLIGDVWFCSGQSNMQMPMKGFYPNSPVEGSSKAIAESGGNTGIRFATVPMLQSYEVQDKAGGKWILPSPETTPDISAVAYFFADQLHKLTDVPLGIIVCAYGGTKVESWMPKWKLDEYGPQYDMDAEQAKSDNEMTGWERVGVTYNAMLHPLIGYTIKGFIWNQGESNVNDYQNYVAHFSDMVDIWRDEWNDGELPFYYVEIPPHFYYDANKTQGAMVREAQREAANVIPNVAYVCTADLAYPFEEKEIHGSIKQPISQRLANLVATKEYGLKGLPHEYPSFEKVDLKGDSAIIYFSQPNGGLLPFSSLDGFEVAGDDKVFYQAEAKCIPENSTQPFNILVTSDKVKDIKAVRYAFKNFYPTVICDHAGMPLIPFRTDNW